MKKTLFSFAIIAFFAQAKAQTLYDFGTTGQASIAPLYVSGTTSPQWPLDNTTPYVPLPANATGGVVSRGNATTGNIQLVNSAISGLTGAYLKFTAGAVSAEVPSKFGIYNNTTATNVATVKFKIHVPASSTAGSYLFCFGNGGATGNTAGVSTGVNVNQNIVVLRFAVGASSVVVNHHNGAGYIGNDFLNGLGAFNKDETQTIALFMNNSNVVKTYELNGTNSLAVGTYDMYVNGVKALAGAATSGLVSGTGASNNLDDMNIMNSVASATESNMYFDDYVYSNALTPSVLPVTFTQLSANSSGSNVQVNWTTASEANNDHFEIEASTDGKTFKTIKTVKTKNGNSSQIQEYQENVTLTDIAGVLALPLLLGFIGFSPASRRRKVTMLIVGTAIMATSFVACQKEGKDLLSQKEQDSNSIINGQKTIYIRIKQVDKNGDFSYSNIVAAK
jgi:hypothetical protein